MVLSIFLFLSCNNENVKPSNPALQMMNLRVGNYWVYDWYSIDETNNSLILKKRDSIFIEKDTIINGRPYYIKKEIYGNQQITKSILFGSISSIYSFPESKVVFTLDKSLSVTQNFGSETNPSAIGYYSVDDNEIPIEVPAGNFQAMNFRGRIEPQQPGYPYGVRYNDNYYVNNVGLVKMRTQFYSSPTDTGMRLVRYGNIN